ncbi:MAG TPA: FAD-dependent oxidoreductase [Bryobacterales bacterium]|jgi:CDP-4-dehydro-6-deoxyglucose reductase|nr:FAD-dependent oxidoreductase [Bryobacterales bacterium]
MSCEGAQTARLIESFPIAPDVRHFLFEAPALERVVFQPGQFVCFHYETGGQIIRRAYSIASPPNGDNLFELCLKRIAGGPLSSYLFQMRSGDEVRFEGPHGGFQLRQPVRNCFFVAAGTGVAPIRSMIGYLLRHGVPPHLQLLLGSRSEECILYRSEFEQFAARHANFRFYPTLTQGGPEWRGLRGRVQEHVIRLAGDGPHTDFYVCGPGSMVKEVRDALERNGADPRSIFYEKYAA